MNKKAIYLATFILSVLLSASCSPNGEPTVGIVEHPVQELIPYHNYEHRLISHNNSVKDLDDLPEELILLHRYLNSPNQLNFENLNLVTKDVTSVEVERISREHFVILDKSEDNLISYNISDNHINKIAGFGRGPGELQHSTDLLLVDNKIYVSRLDMRVSSFNCESGDCLYEDTFQLDTQPISISASHKGIFSISGNEMIKSGESMVNDSEIEFKPVKIIGESGNIIDSFGKVYKTKFRMVLERFNRTGLLAFFTKSGHYVWASSWFPYIYIYSKDYDLIATYRIENHIQNKFEFDTVKQTRSFADRDQTEIILLKPIRQDYILIATSTRTNKNEVGGEIIYDYRIDYYAIDHKNGKNFHIGTSEKASDHQTLIIPIEDMLIKNDGGVLYMVTN